jgi:hypothetical protein
VYRDCELDQTLHGEQARLVSDKKEGGFEMI